MCVPEETRECLADFWHVAEETYGCLADFLVAFLKKGISNLRIFWRVPKETEGCLAGFNCVRS